MSCGDKNVKTINKFYIHNNILFYWFRMSLLLIVKILVLKKDFVRFLDGNILKHFNFLKDSLKFLLLIFLSVKYH